MFLLSAFTKIIIIVIVVDIIIWVILIYLFILYVFNYIFFVSVIKLTFQRFSNNISYSWPTK